MGQQNIIQQAIENNFDFLKFQITPEDSGLDLLDKDIQLGNFKDRETYRIVNYLLSNLHDIETFITTQKVIEVDQGFILMEDFQKLDEESQQKIIKKYNIINKKLYKYPRYVNFLRSKIKSLILSSGSINALKARLQHTTINKTHQTQTLNDKTQKKRFLGKKK